MPRVKLAIIAKKKPVDYSYYTIHLHRWHINANLPSDMVEGRLELSLFRKLKLYSTSIIVIGYVRTILISVFKDKRQYISL